MNIIFDEAIAKTVSDKYTVLELDTVMQPELTKPITLYGLVEINNLNQITTLNFFKEMHQDMIKSYKKGDWEFAIELIQGLMGQFGGELDSFYENILDFCKKSVKVNRTWDGIRYTVPKE